MMTKKIITRDIPDLSKTNPESVQVSLNLDALALLAIWTETSLALTHPFNEDKTKPPASIALSFVREIGRMLMDLKLITKKQYDSAITEETPLKDDMNDIIDTIPEIKKEVEKKLNEVKKSNEVNY